MSDISRGSAAAAALERAVEEMLSEVGKLPAALINWQPDRDVWTVMDILCHVQEFVPYWTDQTLQAIREPGKAWGRDHTHEGRLAAVQNTAARRLDDVRGGLREAAKASAAALKTLTDAELATEATSRNPRWGQKPASFIVDHLIVQHVEKHIGQIRRNVLQFQQRGQSAQ